MKHVEDHVHTRLVTINHVTDMNVEIMERRSRVDANACLVGKEPAVSMVSAANDETSQLHSLNICALLKNAASNLLCSLMPY